MPPKDLFDKGNDVQMMLGNGALADEFRELFVDVHPWKLSRSIPQLTGDRAGNRSP